MIKTNNVLDWLQGWYDLQCDGDWEYEFGIAIKTVDNPGWSVKIDITGTECEDLDFKDVIYEASESDWYYCQKKDNLFDASCSPSNLTHVLKIFRQWVEEGDAAYP